MASDHTVHLVYIDSNNFLYGSTITTSFLILESELEYLYVNGKTGKIVGGDGNQYYNFQNNIFCSVPSDAIELTKDSNAWAQISAGTFVYPSAQEPDTSVYFKTGTYSEYISADKNENTLYFIPNYGIYKGSQQIVSVNNSLTGDSSIDNFINTTINNNQLSAHVNSEFFDWLSDQRIDINEIPAASNCGFIVSGNTLTITDNSLLSDGLINDDDYLMVGCLFTDDEQEDNFIQSLLDNVGTNSIDFRIFNTELINQLGENYNNEGLAICLTNGNNNYYISLNEDLFNNIIWGEFIDIQGVYHYIPIIHKNYILGTNNILNNMELYGMGYDCFYGGGHLDDGGEIADLRYMGNITDIMFFGDMFLENFEDRIIHGTYTISDSVFEYPS